MERRLAVIKLLDPDMCLECRFADLGREIKNENGEISKVVKCNRRDCDNWDYSDVNFSVELLDRSG